jgi:AcrR family transcriptional regulator
MNEKTHSIEEKIIKATIDCIEKFGLEGITNRKIAEMAGVNGAAVNYYFRSKDALVERCMEITLDNGFDLTDFSHLTESSPQDRYMAIINHLIQGACDYPGLTHAHLHNLFSEGKFNSLVESKINKYLDALINDLKEHDVQLGEEELRLAVAQSFAAAMMVSLAPQMFAKNLGLDMNNGETRKLFIQRLVQKLLSS